MKYNNCLTAKYVRKKELHLEFFFRTLDGGKYKAERTKTNDSRPTNYECLCAGTNNETTEVVKTGLRQAGSPMEAKSSSGIQPRIAYILLPSKRPYDATVLTP